MTLGELASRLGASLEGDGAAEILRVAGIEAAGPGDLTFVANAKYAGRLAGTRATAVILDRTTSAAGPAILRVDDPYLAFAKAAQALAPPDPATPGVHPTAVVDADATIEDGASVGPLVVIGRGARIGARSVLRAHVVVGAGAEIGPDCLLHAHVSLRERCRLGARVVVQDGAVIGGDGFGFAHHADGTHEKIPQLAIVVVEDDVEIGANTTIDRPAVGETRIMSGTKIDNLVQIAHGVVIGHNTLLAAQVGIAGSTVIGDSVMFGGQVGVAGHITIGDRVKVTAQTGLNHSIEAGKFVSGLPAIDNTEWRKAAVLFGRLPEFRSRLLDLERRLAALESPAVPSTGPPTPRVP